MKVTGNRSTNGGLNGRPTPDKNSIENMLYNGNYPYPEYLLVQAKVIAALQSNDDKVLFDLNNDDD